MKILHLFPYAPIPPNFGGALRIYNLIKQMSKYHKLTLLTFGNERVKNLLASNFNNGIDSIQVCTIKPWYRVSKLKRFAQFFTVFSNKSFFTSIVQHKEMQNLIDKIIDNNYYDIVQFEFPHMANYDIKTDALKILDAHNVEYRIFYLQHKYAQSWFRKQFYYIEYKKLYAEEIAVCRKQDAILVTSENDANIFNQEIPEIPKYIIPNGVDTNYFTPTNTSPEPKTLVFTGTLQYIPNYDAMHYFIDDILPIIKKSIPDIKLNIVGKNPPKNLIKKSSDNIKITGYVDDVRPYVQNATLFIVPLRMGSGTRLKILEAFAMKKPVISTTIGAEGLNLINGEHALIADKPEEFAEQVIRLLKDISLQKKLVTNSYELVKTIYDWDIIGKRLNTVYENIISNSKVKRSQTTLIKL